MTRLQYVLGFEPGKVYTDDKGWLYRVNSEGVFEYVTPRAAPVSWIAGGGVLERLLNNPEKVRLVELAAPAYSPETIQALRAVAMLWPGWPWIARDGCGDLMLFTGKPSRGVDDYVLSEGMDGRLVGDLMGRDDLECVTWDGGPVFIPDVIGGDKRA